MKTNGVDNLQIIDLKEAKRLEPGVGRDLGYLRREGSKKRIYWSKLHTDE
jgi:hypothetical protein